MSRTRKVINSPTNGGKHCPSLVQKRGCQGFKCHSHSDRRVLRGELCLSILFLARIEHQFRTCVP